MGLGCEWCHARKRGAEIFGDFWKRRQLKFDSGQGQSSRGLQDAQHVCWISESRFDSGLGESSWGLAVGDVGTVSIVKNCVSLSLCRKPKLKKLINVSYLNNESCQCFADFSTSEYFTYSYFGYATWCHFPRKDTILLLLNN